MRERINAVMHKNGKTMDKLGRRLFYWEQCYSHDYLMRLEIDNYDLYSRHSVYIGPNAARQAPLVIDLVWDQTE